MPDSLYDPARYDSMTPANVIGGINRAKAARRDRYGRFLPQSHDLPEPDRHGAAGGQARAIKALRDERGRFRAG